MHEIATFRKPTASRGPLLAAVVLLVLFITGCSVSSRSTRSNTADEAAGTAGAVRRISEATPQEEPLSPYGNPPYYEVDGKRYIVLKSSQGYGERGIASWYGPKFHGRRASSGETYDMYAMTAAHKTLPLPTYVEVTNLQNGRQVVVRINDRGPFVGTRLIDLSYAAAEKLAITDRGTALVEVRAIDPGPDRHKTPGKARLDASNLQLFIQVGAFANRDNAVQLRNRLLGAQIPKIRVEPHQREGRCLYRVWVGPIASVEDADRMSEVLTDLGVEKLRVVIQ